MKDIKKFINEATINEATDHIELDTRFKWKNGVEFLFLGINTDDYGFLTANELSKVFRDYHVEEIKKLKAGESWFNDDCFVIKIK